MAGWNKKKVAVFKAAFFDFLKYVQIASKDVEGYQALQLFDAQHRFLDAVFAGLEEDIHDFTVLKARQLGMSTIVRVLIVFWAFVHKGLRIALVYDTEKNRAAAQLEIKQFLERLPSSHSILNTKHNRDLLELENGSVIYYLVAGVKQGKGSGGLGRSLGVNCTGATEISSWGDIEGLKAFQRSLSSEYPNRLYIWESTARGFNIFYDLVQDAKTDDLAKRFIFIGWWAKDSYKLKKGTPIYERYASAPPTKEEQAKIQIVKERYNHEITLEQLAWYRHEFDPNVEAQDVEREGEDIMLQELPWFEEEAWRMPGAVFFPSDKLAAAATIASKTPVKGFRYLMGGDFLTTCIEPTTIPRQAVLRVWEEPDPNGVYVIGADPAYGSNEKSNRHCAQILRCYADGVDQVAEFCVARMETYQFAWVLAHLCGAYANARLLLELNGPGQAVLNAFRELEMMVRSGLLREAAEERGLKNIFDNVKHYMYSRQDSLTKNPTAFHFVTTERLKVTIMERFRDHFVLGSLQVRSMDLLREMEKITREEDSISGAGTANDDRVMAMAMAVRAWEDSEKRKLVTSQRTRVNEQKRKHFSPEDLQEMFGASIIQGFLQNQARDRLRARREARRGNRYRW